MSAWTPEPQRPKETDRRYEERLQLQLDSVNHILHDKHSWLSEATRERYEDMARVLRRAIKEARNRR